MQTCLIIFRKIISSKTSCIQAENKWFEGETSCFSSELAFLCKALVSLGKLKPARIPWDFQPVTSRSTHNNGWSSTFCIFANVGGNLRLPFVVTSLGEGKACLDACRQIKAWSKVHTKSCYSVSPLVCVRPASFQLNKGAHTPNRWHKDHLAS